MPKFKRRKEKDPKGTAVMISTDYYRDMLPIERKKLMWQKRSYFSMNHYYKTKLEILKHQAKENRGTNISQFRPMAENPTTGYASSTYSDLAPSTQINLPTVSPSSRPSSTETVWQTLHNVNLVENVMDNNNTYL